MTVNQTYVHISAKDQNRWAWERVWHFRGHKSSYVDMQAKWSLSWPCKFIVMFLTAIQCTTALHIPFLLSSSTSLETISSTLFLNQNISCHAMRHFGSRHLYPMILTLRLWWRKSVKVKASIICRRLCTLLSHFFVETSKYQWTC